MIYKIYLIMDRFSKEMKRKNINSSAAGISYFIFISLVPMLVMICTIIPFTPLTEENLVHAVTEITPDIIDELVISLIGEVYDASAGILSIAVIATLWAAGKGILSLTQGLNAIEEVEEERNYFLLRVIASFYTLIMLAAVISTLILILFGNKIFILAVTKVPSLRYMADFIMNFRLVFNTIILTLVFTVIYTYISNAKLKFKEQLPGAFTASVAWSVFSWGFSIYVNNYNSYSIYGSLSLIVIIMLWLYFGMYILLIGAYINWYFRPVNRVLVNRKKTAGRGEGKLKGGGGKT